jgi:hypothetical protein
MFCLICVSRTSRIYAPFSVNMSLNSLEVTSVTLELLFRYRSAYRRIAASSTNVHHASAIVSWVDVLVVKLTKIIVHLISYAPKEYEKHRMPPSLYQRKEDDLLRAAAQLPRKFSHFQQHMIYLKPSFSRMVFGSAMDLVRTRISSCVKTSTFTSIWRLCTGNTIT